MLYGINFITMHTAIHGIFVFETEEEAIANYKLLVGLEYGERDIEDEEEYISHYEYSVQSVYDNAFDVIEEVDFRDIVPVMRDFYDDELLKIVNDVTVDIY